MNINTSRSGHPHASSIVDPVDTTAIDFLLSDVLDWPEPAHVVSTPPQLSGLDGVPHSRPAEAPPPAFRKTTRFSPKRASWSAKQIEKRSGVESATLQLHKRTLKDLYRFMHEKDPTMDYVKVLVRCDENEKNRWIKNFCEGKDHGLRDLLNMSIVALRKDPAVRNNRYIPAEEDEPLISALQSVSPVTGNRAEYQGIGRRISETLLKRSMAPRSLKELLSLAPEACNAILYDYNYIQRSARTVEMLRQAWANLKEGNHVKPQDTRVDPIDPAESAQQSISSPRSTALPWAPTLD